MITSGLERPTSIDQALHALSDRSTDAKVVAGGTALVLMMQQGLVAPGTLISLDRCRELRGIQVLDRHVLIGATTTLTEVATHPEIRRWLPSLADACGRVGNVRIRNAATLGGNLAEADYASDPPSLLCCLGASCRALSVRGERWIPAHSFGLGFYENALADDEILVSISVPMPTLDERSIYLKYVSRSSEDRPCVGVAARSSVRDGVILDVDVVIGAVAPTPQRDPATLQAAIGSAADGATARDVALSYSRSFDLIEDLRGSGWYRRKMIEVHVERALTSLWNPSTGAAR